MSWLHVLSPASLGVQDAVVVGTAGTISGRATPSANLLSDGRWCSRSWRASRNAELPLPGKEDSRALPPLVSFSTDLMRAEWADGRGEAETHHLAKRTPTKSPREQGDLHRPRASGMLSQPER